MYEKAMSLMLSAIASGGLLADPSIVDGTINTFSWGQSYVLRDGESYYQVVKALTAGVDAEWTVPAGKTIQYLLVGGGGSGGFSYHAGDNIFNPGAGGAGAFIRDAVTFDAETTVTLRVGAGGAAVTGVDTTTGAGARVGNGLNGEATELSWSGAVRRRAPGGGGGADDYWNDSGKDSVGSGGGGVGYYNRAGGRHLEGEGVEAGAQGHDGAAGSGNLLGGGGGGAGSAAAGKNGGEGLSDDITGRLVWYAGGGAPEYGQGGSGVGGQPERKDANTNIERREAVANTGSGGYAGTGRHQASGAGADGIAVLRYALDAPPAVRTFTVVEGSVRQFPWVTTYVLQDSASQDYYQIVKATHPGRPVQWTVPAGATVEYLLVGGGGSGGYSHVGTGSENAYNPGGGGAGAVIHDVATFGAETTVTIEVGAGGAAVTTAAESGRNGGDTVLSWDGVERRRAPGGGGGATSSLAEGMSAGGSGGGGHALATTGGIHLEGRGTSANALGNSGAAGGAAYVGGGGGGAGSAGGAAAGRGDGAFWGGRGVEFDITGTMCWYAGGGAAEYGEGGSGVGGQFLRIQQYIEGSQDYEVRVTTRLAAPNTGSGGAAGVKAHAASGAGADGVAVLRYRIANPPDALVRKSVRNKPWGETFYLVDGEKRYQVVKVTAADTDVVWTVPNGVDVEYLVVGGGGSGGYSKGIRDNDFNPGAGGAGAVLYDSVSFEAPTELTLRVGAGGAAVLAVDETATDTQVGKGLPGGASSIAWAGSVQRNAPGGGGGACDYWGGPGQDSVGSGGGGIGRSNTLGGWHLDGEGASAGAIGNSGSLGTGVFLGGGGGGAGGTAKGANGGDGLEFYITGSAEMLAGGGAAEYGIGGSGVGGHPQRYDATHATAVREAVANTGSGGRAGVGSSQGSGAGAAGVVVLRYLCPKGGLTIIVR